MTDQNLVAIAQQLSSNCAQRAPHHDESDTFVIENHESLKAAGVPKELGGLDAESTELCDMLRIMAHSCSSTALTFSIHTHQVAIPT